MSRCDYCGNDYDKAFDVIRGSDRKSFDSFECAIAAMAPRCVACDLPIIGHGLESEGKIYCCNHCATQQGVRDLRDRA